MFFSRSLGERPHFVLPIVMLGWLKALIGFFVVTFVCGLFISIVFQLAHVVESTDFPSEKKIEIEWAIHQVSTTSNFATANKLLFWMLGGLKSNLFAVAKLEVVLT